MVVLKINENKQLAYTTSEYKYNTRFTIFSTPGNVVLCSYALYLRIHDDLFTCDFVLVKETNTTKDNIKVFKVTENIINEVIQYIFSIESEVIV